MQGPLLLVVLFAFCNVAGAEDAASCEGDDPALLQSKQTRSFLGLLFNHSGTMVVSITFRKQIYR